MQSSGPSQIALIVFADDGAAVKYSPYVGRTTWLWRTRHLMARDQCPHYGPTTSQQFQHRGRRAILVPESTRLNRKEAEQRTLIPTHHVRTL